MYAVGGMARLGVEGEGVVEGPAGGEGARLPGRPKLYILYKSCKGCEFEAGASSKAQPAVRGSTMQIKHIYIYD